MTSNSQVIIQDIRADFEKMLEYVTGEEARRAMADTTERGLFKMLIEMGLKLLTLFFEMRSQNADRENLRMQDGSVLYSHRDTPRKYVSIFGKLCFARPYFYRSGLGGQAPLDAELSLGEDCYSDLVREVHDYLSVHGVYHKASEIVGRLLGLTLSTRALQTNLAEDAADVSNYYDQKPAPVPSSEVEILVIQADGKGVPLISEKPKNTFPSLSLSRTSSTYESQCFDLAQVLFGFPKPTRADRKTGLIPLETNWGLCQNKSA